MGKAGDFIRKTAASAAASAMNKFSLMHGQNQSIWDFGCLNADATKITLSSGLVFDVVTSGRPGECGPVLRLNSTTYYMPGKAFHIIQVDGGLPVGLFLLQTADLVPGHFNTKFLILKSSDQQLYDVPYPDSFPNTFDPTDPFFNKPANYFCKLSPNGVDLVQFLVINMPTADTVDEHVQANKNFYWRVITNFSLDKGSDPNNPVYTVIGTNQDDNLTSVLSDPIFPEGPDPTGPIPPFTPALTGTCTYTVSASPFSEVETSTLTDTWFAFLTETTFQRANDRGTNIFVNLDKDGKTVIDVFSGYGATKYSQTIYRRSTFLLEVNVESKTTTPAPLSPTLPYSAYRKNYDCTNDYKINGSYSFTGPYDVGTAVVNITQSLAGSLAVTCASGSAGICPDNGPLFTVNCGDPLCPPGTSGSGCIPNGLGDGTYAQNYIGWGPYGVPEVGGGSTVCVPPVAISYIDPHFASQVESTAVTINIADTTKHYIFTYQAINNLATRTLSVVNEHDIAFNPSLGIDLGPPLRGFRSEIGTSSTSASIWLQFGPSRALLFSPYLNVTIANAKAIKAGTGTFFAFNDQVVYNLVGDVNATSSDVTNANVTDISHTKPVSSDPGTGSPGLGSYTWTGYGLPGTNSAVLKKFSINAGSLSIVKQATFKNLPQLYNFSYGLVDYQI